MSLTCSRMRWPQRYDLGRLVIRGLVRAHERKQLRSTGEVIGHQVPLLVDEAQQYGRDLAGGDIHDYSPRSPPADSTICRLGSVVFRIVSKQFRLHSVGVHALGCYLVRMSFSLRP